MPLTPPPLDTRSHQDLVNEALARIPVHTPAWTNFNAADPGVTLIEAFAYLTESLLYRANQVPERHRSRFLQLLGVPLAPAASARGLVVFSNDKGKPETVTLPAGLEVRAAAVPFRTERGLDVLPVEARLYRKQPVADAGGALGRHVQLLYASLKNETVDVQTDLTLYETVAVDSTDGKGLSLGDDTVDGCLWIALLARADDAKGAADKAKLRDSLRLEIGGRTLSLGIVPALGDSERRLGPGGSAADLARPLLRFQVPKLPEGGKLPQEPAPRDATYRTLDAVARADVLSEPGVVEIQLPSADALRLWDDLDPLEKGTGQFPPALDDATLDERVLTWIRVSCDAALKPRLLWVGVGAVPVVQRDRVAGERLEDGNGEPDQVRRLAHPPLLPGSLRLRVQADPPDGAWDDSWSEADDLLAAGPEVRVADPRLPPGAPQPPPARAEVFSVDPEAGTLTFGDGHRGRRPAAGARLVVSYDHSDGAAGNVGRGSINAAPSLPSGFSVTNPVRTWGGSAAETVVEGEKQVTRYLQHRDRLVSVADFEAITLRTPGVDIGRVEVLPAFSPELSPDAPGNAPGSVTLMLVPRSDAAHPNWPEPDRLFLNAVCRHLDPRRLITTELLLRGPAYRGLWITVGIDVLALGRSAPEVREDVKLKLIDFLAPWRDIGLPAPDAAYADMERGWPLRKTVSALELMAVASRVKGVRLVHAVRLADSAGIERSELPLIGLQLPRVEGILVQIGDAPDPRDLIAGSGASGDGPPTRRVVPVPVIPEAC